MASSSNLIRVRLAWCRVQRREAMTQEDAERYLAEEHGLLDAMHGTDRTEIYRNGPQFWKECYETGLHDGRALLGLQRWSEAHPLRMDNSRGHYNEMPSL